MGCFCHDVARNIVAHVQDAFTAVISLFLVLSTPQTLREYAEYVRRVRQYAKKLLIADAVGAEVEKLKAELERLEAELG